MQNLSAVLIAPDEHREAVNAALEKLGWGPGNLSVALAHASDADPTHWGCRAKVGDTFAEAIATATGHLKGMTVDIRDSLDIEFASSHFLEVAKTWGLVRVCGSEV